MTVMKTSSMLLFSEYDPMIEMTMMKGVMIAYGTRMIIASSGTASRHRMNVIKWPR